MIELINLVVAALALGRIRYWYVPMVCYYLYFMIVAYIATKQNINITALLVIGELANLTAMIWLYRFEKKKEDEIPDYLFFP